MAAILNIYYIIMIFFILKRTASPAEVFYKDCYQKNLKAAVALRATAALFIDIFLTSIRKSKNVSPKSETVNWNLKNRKNIYEFFHPVARRILCLETKNDISRPKSNAFMGQFAAGD